MIAVHEQIAQGSSKEMKMEEQYYLANLKLSGWLSKSHQVTTDIKEARVLGRNEALALARRHKQAGAILLPVRLEDMEMI